MRKRLFAGLLVLCMIFNVMPATALAEETAPKFVCAGAETEGECEAAEHIEGCAKYAAPVATCAGAETEGECEATEHIEGCAKYVAPVATCVGAETEGECEAAEHIEGCAKYVAPVATCAGAETEGECEAAEHIEGCAKYVAPVATCAGAETEGECEAAEHVEGCEKYAVPEESNNIMTTSLDEGTDSQNTIIDTVDKLNAAIAGAKEGETVTLGADITISESVNINRKVTLDLNGHTITGIDNNDSGNFYLINIDKGDLTINDTKGSGKITLKANTERNWLSSSVVVANNQGILTVEGGTIEHLGGTSMAYGIDNLTNGDIGEAKTTVKGGIVDSTYFAIRQFANSATKMNKVVIEGGDISYVWMQSPNTGTNIVATTVTDGEVDGICVSGVNAEYTLSASTSAVATVYGTMPTGEVLYETADRYSVDTLQGAINVAEAGQTVTLLEDASGDGVVIDKDITIDFEGHTYTVSGETVGSNGTETLGFQILQEHNVALKNGTITTASEKAKMLIQNYADLTITDMNLTGKDNVTQYVLSNNNGTVLINGSTNITAPAGAVAFDVYDYQAGGYKGVNVTVDTTGTIKGMVEVSGDGAAPNPVLTVNNGTFVSDKDGFVVEKGEVTINKATVNAGTKNDGSWCAVWANGGTVVINDGTFHTGKDENGKGNDTIYTKNDGKVTIYGGTFSSEVESTSYAKPQYALLNENDANRGTIIVYGGTFVKFDPSNNVSEGANTNFTANGTHTSKNGDEYNVHAYVEATGVGAKADTCTEAGHTGDKVCKTCGTVIEAGTTIDEITGHDFDKETGKCKNGCGAETYVGDVEVVVEPEETEGKVSSSISEDMKETANKIASSVEAAEKTLTEAVKDAAQTYTKDEELIKEAKKALKADANDDITITVKPHLETEIKMITEEKPEEDKPVLTVEINLVYDVVAAKEGDNKEVHLKEVTVSNPGKAIELSFEVSDDIAGMLQELVDAGKKLYIRHPKSNGDVYFHEATLGDNTITFTNDAGFSEFTLMYGDEVPENIIKTSGSSSKKSIATIVETGEYVPTASVSETIIEEGKEELGKLIGDSYGLHKLALAVELEGTLSEKTKVKILVDDVTKSDSTIILQKTEDGWKAVSATAGDGYVIGKFTSLSEILIFVNPDGEIEAAQAAAATAATAQAAGTTPVATGDTANILGYAVIIVAAAMAVLYFRKHRA